MGTTASTRCHVKTITTELNNPDWMECDRRRARHSIPIIGSMFAKGPARPPPAQIRKDKVSLIKRAIKAEAEAKDCEVKIKILERQLRTIELRNHDLSTELVWVKQQKEDNPLKTPFTLEKEVENASMTVTSEALINKLKTENEELRENSLNLMTSEVMKDIKITDLEREKEEYRQRITHLEELYRDKIDDHSLASVSPSPIQTSMLTLNSSDELNKNGEESEAQMRKRSQSTTLKPDKSMGMRRASLPKGFKESAISINGFVTDEEEDFDLTDILSTSVRSTTKSVRSQSGKSHDSGFSLSDSTTSQDRSIVIA
ncbi:unnamed protein product [Auanema sp. JU1783]|nr:unnamed protein product [Auanema sp. JU1783]